MNILALEPYYGGSHQAFLDGWSSRSRHQFAVLTLPAYKWKWRMRHAAITFAEQVDELIQQGNKWDFIFCSDMLNLAEFKGLIPKQISDLPAIVYFHENQLTYPVQSEDERDYQFSMTNITTVLSAEQVWFNSGFHRDSFLNAVEKFLRKMPDHQPAHIINQIKSKVQIHYPGIEKFSSGNKTKSKRLSILYCARWEHDKNPDDFFDAMKSLKNTGIDFQLNVIGEHFREVPEIFKWAKNFFKDNINKWGYQKSKEDYLGALSESDIVISTANHEFFGISIIEAISAGAYPLLPKRLSYPEILDLEKNANANDFFYDGSVKDLIKKTKILAKNYYDSKLWTPEAKNTLKEMSRFHWKNIIPILDDAVEASAKLIL